MKLLITFLLLFSYSVQAENVPLQADLVRPLLPGMMIPEIKVKDQNGKQILISPSMLEKPFVIAFYRGGWCPYCNAQLAGFKKAEKKLAKMGYDLYFISPDRPENLVSTIKDEDLKNEIDYTLLSDSKMKVAVDFGVAFKVDDETVEKYKKWNIDLEKASGESHHWLPAPSVFLVGTDGIIRFQYTNPNYKVRLDPEVLLAAAKSYIKNFNK